MRLPSHGQAFGFRPAVRREVDVRHRMLDAVWRSTAASRASSGSRPIRPARCMRPEVDIGGHVPAWARRVDELDAGACAVEGEGEAAVEVRVIVDRPGGI